MLITIFIFIIILGLLVFVHEAGHFFAAKNSGMKVDEFGFGFPPRIVGLQKVNGKMKIILGHPSPDTIGTGQANSQQLSDSTIYSINAIPLGGFVKIVGENNDAEDNPQSFVNKPFSRRLLTLVAGVLMNVVLAWFLISLGYIVGLPVAVDTPANLPPHARLAEPRAVVVEVQADSPAAKAGLQQSDIILSIDGKAVNSVLDVQSYVVAHKGNVLNFEVKRINEIKKIEVRSLKDPPAGQGPTGIALATFGKLTFPWYGAVVEGAKTTGQQLKAIVVGLYQVFASGQGLKSLGGPVKIAKITGQVADLGVSYLIQFTAFLSLNLAILNILPFPALDGGRVLFLIIEKVRGKRNNQKVEQFANTIGFVLLLLLMVVVTFRDIKGF